MNSIVKTATDLAEMNGEGRQRRNRAFEETHRELIEAAVGLIAEKGVNSLSIRQLDESLWLVAIFHRRPGQGAGYQPDHGLLPFRQP